MANLSNTESLRSGYRSQIRKGYIRNIGLFSDGSVRVGLMVMNGKQQSLMPVADHNELEEFNIGDWVKFDVNVDQKAINLAKVAKGKEPRDFAGKS